MGAFKVHVRRKRVDSSSLQGRAPPYLYGVPFAYQSHSEKHYTIAWIKSGCLLSLGQRVATLQPTTKPKEGLSLIPLAVSGIQRKTRYTLCFSSSRAISNRKEYVMIPHFEKRKPTCTTRVNQHFPPPLLMLAYFSILLVISELWN